MSSSDLPILQPRELIRALERMGSACSTSPREAIGSLTTPMLVGQPSQINLNQKRAFQRKGRQQMAAKETRTVDARARVTLPPRFAKATVILEQVSESEVRIRRTGGNGDAPVEFAEETSTTLSDRDRDRFLRLLEKPSPPNAALRKAMSKR